MSRLKELIEELCPKGIKYLSLGSCCHLEKGITPIQKAIKGEYPLVVTADKRKTSNIYQFDKPTVCVPLISSRGHGVASLNKIYYQDGKFALGNILCGVTPKDESQLSARFLYFYLNYAKNTLLVPLMKGGANVSMSVESLKKVKIPVPPLQIQQEIVNILRTFEKMNELLESEYYARKQQYKYYMDKILSDIANSPNIKWEKISDICKRVISGGTPKSNNEDFYEGDIPWLRTQEINWNNIYDTTKKITDEGLKNSSAKWIPENCVIVAMYGATAGKVAINKIPITTNQACCNLQIDEGKALYRYVYYWLYKEYENIKAMGQGSQSNINIKIIKQYLIPIPSIDKQQDIVNSLDKFDDLCQGYKYGLPAEIKARVKQYEYYQDKLFSFKEL